MKYALIFIALVVGIGIGKASEDSSAYAPTPTKVVTKERVVTKTVTKKVPVVPDVCADSISAAKRATKAIGAYENILGRETTVQEESYRATTMNEKNRVSEEHRDIIDDTVDAALEIQQVRTELARTMKACRKYSAK